MKLLLDSSVWLAWLRADDEPNHAAATQIVQRRLDRSAELRLLDLTLYEIGNVIVRAWRRPCTLADGFIERVMRVANGAPLVPTPAERRAAHAMADEHGLSVYDATYAAVARERRLTLVSGGARLVGAGLASAPGAV